MKKHLTPELIRDTIDLAILYQVGEGMSPDAAFDRAFHEMGFPTVLDYATGNVAMPSAESEETP